MAEITVDVGVRLKAMQSSVADLQKVLDGLQPNSSGFKALQRIIADINRDMDRLRIQTSKPFGSQNQFNQTEKTVDKLEESLEKVKITIDRIKFSDLKLDSSQTAQLDNFKQQLKDIKQEFTDFKADLKGQFLDNDFNKAFVEGINPNLINKNFDEIIKNVNSKVDSLGSALARAKADLEEFKNASKLGEKIDKIPDEGLVSQAGLGENFKKFFQINSKGIFGFKTGGGLQKGEIKQQFIKYLTEEFQLTEGQIKQLQDQTTAKAIRDLLSNKDFFNTQLNAATTANKKMSGAESTFTTASKNYENAAAVVARLTPLLSALSNEELSLEDKQKLVNQAIREFEKECVNGAKGSKTMDTALTGLDSQLNSFKTQLGQVNAQWLNLQKQQATFNSMKSAIVNFMGFNQVLNLTKKAVKEAMDHIKQLDTVMNGIAIVTDMTTADLWNQVDVYSEMAQRYGTSIQGAYEVSKIYYQAGYETNEVLTLMNETLKMSKISGLDYATTTDYMMNAVKGFKMEVADAASVVDVYSALAANTAVSQQELAEAMSKTASSMAGVGSTFEDTSAMIATMVSVTRESANNIGSAMKSIASRYGELTKDPTKLLDAEGEAMSFNKVDTALKSVGITLQTTDHQFRDFTDVIVELAEKWDTLDSAQQRYIATQFAGNRQQNRFLALVSNKDLLQENMEVAAASEDTGTLQALKALDSLESKLNQVQVAYQQFYTTIGVENVWKAFLDGTENVINTLNNLPKLFGKIPVGAITVIYDIISLIKTAALNGLSEIVAIWQNNLHKVEQTNINTRPVGDKMIEGVLGGIKSRAGEIQQAFNNELQSQPTKGEIYKQEVTQQFQTIQSKYENPFYQSTHIEEYKTELLTLVQTLKITGQSFEELKNKIQAGKFGEVSSVIQDTINSLNTEGTVVENLSNKWNNLKTIVGSYIKNSKHLASDMNGFASALNMIGALINTTNRQGQITSGSLMSLAGAFRLGSVAVQAFQGTLNGIPWMAIAMGIVSVINGLSTIIETPTEKLERLTKEAENLNNEAKKAKAEYNTLQRSVDKLDELKEKRYESAEAAEIYQSAVEDLASKFPEMIAGFDEAGNIILDTTDAERILAEARAKSKQATYDAAKAEMDAAKEKLNREKEELPNLQLGLGENNSFNAGKNRYVDFFKDEKGNLTESSLLEDFGYKKSHGLPNSSLEEGISFETFKNELYDLASKYSEDQASIWYFLWDYIDEEKETLTDVDALKNVLQNKIQSNDEGAQKYQELLNLLTDNTALEIQSTEIENLFKQIKEPDFDLAANAEQLTSLSLKLEEILKDTNLDENAKAYYENLQIQLKPIIDKVKNIFTLNEAYKGNERIVISAWQQANDNNGKAWEYLEESSGLAAIVTKQIQSDIGDIDYTTAEAEQASKWKEYQAAAEQFYSGLSETDQKIFNQMIEDTANYSGIDIAKYFNITEGTDLYNAIINYYSDGVKSIQDRLKNNLTAHHDVDFSSLKETDTDFISNYAKLISDENNKFTKNEESFLNSILSQFDSLNKQGFVKRAEVIGLAGINLFEEIQTLPEDIQKSLINSILQNGLITKEGIQKTLDSFKNDKTVTGTQVDEILTNISSQIIDNVNLGIQTATSNLLENWDDTSKELTKALSGGLEFKEAEALITKAESLGVSLDLNTDFVQNGDKLILTSKKFNEYWKKLNKQSEKNAEEWQADIDAAQAIFLNQVAPNGQKNRISIEDKATMTAIGFDWSQYLDQYGYLTVDGIIALQKAIQESSEGLERYNTYAEMAAQQLKQTQEWILGDYSSLSLSPEALKELSSGKTVLKREDYNLRAARENINSAYNSLISDVLSKGFDKINLEDYSGLIDAGKGIDLANTSYEDFVREYAIWAGKSIEETNSLIIQAIEKDIQTTTGAAAEAVGKIQWLSSEGKGFAALKDIQTLADALGISVDAILGEYNAQLDAYKVDVSQIDLSKIDNFTESVYDSINEFLKKVTGNISKGISGKLSSADVTTLTGQLEQLGLKDITLDFTRTVDGLKLSQRSAMELYNELKKIDALQAQLVFDELAKSLEASDTNYTNISTTLARIAELEKAIQEMKPDDARLQMYKNELAVAQEIVRTRSSTDNKDFNFMDRALPTGMQNPIDYWNSTGEAFKAMNTAAKSGYMEIQDFYNIVQEMNNMAAVSGQNLEFMGQTLSGKAEDAASLIQSGFSALTNIKGDGVKIALNNIGTDFTTGAEAMKGDFDDGIRSMAKAQISMLDAAINMLEAIVAMEDIDVDSNGFLNDIEIFNDDGTFTTNVENWLTKLDTLTGGIEIGGKSFRDALLELDPKDIQKVLNDLYNIDWSLGDMDVFSQIQNVLQAYYPNTSITQGTSIFELLKIPKNAGKTSEDFNNWIKEVGLSANQAERLISLMSHGGNIGTIDSTYGQAIQKLLGIDEKTSSIFKDFIQNNKISTDEIKMWSNLNLSIEEDGSITSAIYNGSDGGSISLSEDIGAWQTEIQNYEFALQKARQLGGDTVIANEDNSEFTFKTQIGAKEIITMTSNEQTSYQFPNGFTTTADSPREAALAYANDLIAKDTKGIITGGKTAEEVLVELGYIVSESTTVEFKQGEKTPAEQAQAILDEEKASLDEILASVEPEFNEKTGQYDWKINLPDVGDIEFATDGQELTADQLKQKALEALGLDTSLIDSIATAIKTAFTQDNSIGKAIGEGIKTALTTSIDENDQPQDIPLPTLILKPESVTIQLGEKEPTVQGLDGAGIKITSADISADNAYVSSTSYQAGTSESPLTTVSLEAIDSATGEATTLYINCPNGTVIGNTVTLTGFTANGTATTFTVDNTTGELSTKEAINVPISKADGFITGFFWIDPSGAAYTGLKPDTKIENLKGISKATGEAVSITVECGEKTSVAINDPNVTIDDEIKATAEKGKVTLTKYTISTVDGEGNINTLVAFGEADLTAKLIAYGAGFENGTSNVSGTANLTANISSGPIEIDGTVKTDYDEVKADIEGRDPIKIQAILSDPTKDWSPSYQSPNQGSSNSGQQSSVSIDLSGVANQIKAIQDAQDSIKTDKVEAIQTEQGKIESSNVTAIQTAQNQIRSDRVESIKTAASLIDASHIQAVKRAIDSISGTLSVTLRVALDTSGMAPAKGALGNISTSGSWKGNTIGNNANYHYSRSYAKGTLMGELGPEMVVSHGRYFVVGQNGPEMINLAEDAIVFNHLQTEQLLRHGKASGHAKPVTNERKATSLATGNAGPAMASASAALDTLKQLRSMWQSLLSASLKDLGAMGGAGGGGGGGGGDNNTKGVLKDIERWYNWLKQIEATQTKINKLTKEYTLLEKQGAKTSELAVNLQKQAANLNKNIKTRTALVEEQTGYRDSLLDQVRGKTKGGYNLLSAFYKVGKNNELQIKDDKRFEKYLKNGVSVNAREFYSNKEIEESDGKIKAGDVKNTKSVQLKAKNGLELMKELQKQDQYGNLIYSAEDQLKVLKQLGLGKYLEKDASGNVLKDASEKVEYFFAQLESGEKEISDLTNSIDEGEQSILDDKIAIEEINEQLKEMVTPVEGITERLEQWYEWSRKIVENQHKLNLLTTKYNQLQNSLGNNSKKMRENLEKQFNQTQEQIINTKNERKERKIDLKKQVKLVEATAGKFYKKDENNNFVLNTEGFGKGFKVPKNGFKITTKSLKKGKNGKYLKNDDGSYIYNEKTRTAKIDTSSADKFLTDLTAKNKYGKAKFTDQQQREILEQAGLSDEIAKFANIDWKNSTEEERNEAVKEYLEYLKEVPEEYNKAKDAINENIEKEEELKNKLLEYNNQIRESLKQHDGVTEKLEVGYNWIRKITTEQAKLNILTQRYNNLQKKRDSGLSAVSDIELANNLIQRGKAIKNEQEYNTELRSDKNDELEKARNELINNLYNKKFFTLDEDKNVVYSDELISLKDKNIKVNEISRDKKGREIHIDENGNEIYYGKKGYQEAQIKYEEKEYKLSDIFKLDTNGKISPENFINTLMEKDIYGNPILSLEKQIASVKAIMGNNFEKNVLPKFGDFENWNEANEAQQKEAWTKYLESLSSSVEYVNNLEDGVKNLDIEAEKLIGDEIETNAELKELAETVAGLENPFEKWYNWTQKIKKEQNQLNLLTKEYTILQNDNIANGDEIARNLKQQLVNLEHQQKTTRGYLAEQKEEKDILLNRLNNNDAMSRLFSYNEEAGLQFNNNIDFSKFKESLEQGIDIKDYNINPEKETFEVKTHIFSTEDFKNITSMTDFFEELGKRDEITGKSKYNVEEQFAVALEAGFKDLMQYDESGNKIFINGIENATKEQAEKAVKALFSNTQEFMEAFNEVEDGIQNNLETDYEIQNKINEIYKQLKDNEIDLENTIMASLESLKQKEIDNVQDIRDDLSTASGKLLKGLNDSLNKEKNLYAKNENQQNIDQLQQKIALLQRSGGSGSEIQSLQRDLASKQKEMYFDERQEQINAIQEASDLELEKLEQQISIMTETLEYQKENGLLWNNVYEVMRGTPEQIAAFISENDAKYKALSNLQFEDSYTDILQNAQIYKSAIDEIIANQNLTKGEEEGEIDEKQFKTKLLEGISNITIALPNEENKNKTETSLETISERLNQILGNGDESDANLKTIEAAITDSNNNTISKIIGDGEKTNLGSIEESFLEKIDEIKTELTNEIDIFTKTIATLQQYISDNISFYSENLLTLIRYFQDNIIAESINTKNLLLTSFSVINNDNEYYGEEIIERLKGIKRVLNNLKNISGSLTLNTDNTSATINLQHYDKGGLNTKTGLAWLDGTPSKPEYVLNAEQTAILREALLGSKPLNRSIASISAELTGSENVMSSYYNSVNHNDVIEINGLSLNLNVPAVASDYDASKIGEIAMNEIVKIARKSGTRSLSRR